METELLMMSDKKIGWTVFAALAGVLVVLVVYRSPSENRMRRAATVARMSAYHAALQVMRDDCGFFPADTTGLNALIRNPGNDRWKGPYLREPELIPDAWETEIRYSLVDGVPVLCSAGPDTKFGTEDDIVMKRGEDGTTSGARY